MWWHVWLTPWGGADFLSRSSSNSRSYVWSPSVANKAELSQRHQKQPVLHSNCVSSVDPQPSVQTTGWCPSVRPCVWFRWERTRDGLSVLLCRYLTWPCTVSNTIQSRGLTLVSAEATMLPHWFHTSFSFINNTTTDRLYKKGNAEEAEY